MRDFLFFSLSIKHILNLYFMDTKFCSLIRFTLKEHYIISLKGGGVEGGAKH
jgi:hypothetical protein